MGLRLSLWLGIGYPYIIYATIKKYSEVKIKKHQIINVIIIIQINLFEIGPKSCSGFVEDTGWG